MRRRFDPRGVLLYGTVAFAAFFFVPLVAYVLVGERVPAALRVLHYMFATAYLFTAVVTVLETSRALRRRKAPLAHGGLDLPKVSVIVAAYLPNEQDLIAETLLHLSTAMEVETYRLQIILAYNTPEDLPVEDVIRSLASINASFTPLRVEGSRSKAENIRAALPLLEGEMTVILDADHHPHPEAFARAYRWLTLGYDVVQGRCVVRNQRSNLLTRYVTVEFEQMYAVAHSARSLSVDTAIFGGTNGYWRTEVLQKTGMDPTMLTEDIDASVRAMLAGARFLHDRSVISSELATERMRAWWHQRTRWAQGWFQVTLRHQRAILRSSLRRSQKAYWTYLLSWREIYPILSIQVAGLLLASRVLDRGFSWFGSPYLFWTAVVTLAAGVLTALAAYRVALWRTKESMRPWFVVYAVTALAYTTLKNLVAMLAIVRNSLGDERWVVTDRPIPAAAVSEA